MPPKKSPAPKTETILGIEGGGTKTTWALLDRSERMIRQGITTAGNLQHMSDAQLGAMLNTIRIAAGAEVSAIGGAFAGCHLPAEKKQIEVWLRRLWPSVGKIVVGEDTRSAFAGAHHSGDGLIVIAGTGANVQGHAKGRWEKAGGWGSLVSDPGSGYDLAHHGLQAIYTYYDQTRKVTALGREFLRRSGQNSLPELVPYVLEHSSKTEIADLAPALFVAAKAGDILAKRVLEERAGVLADRVFDVTRRLKLKKPNIGLIGSLFEKAHGYEVLFARLVRRRIDAGRIFVSRTPGAVGAARMVSSPGAVRDPVAAPEKKATPTAAGSYAELITEGRNPRSGGLEKKSVAALVGLFVEEERFVQAALRKARPSLEAAAGAVAAALKKKGRCFYVGAGTSGRLGVLDASEMPPTFNVPPDLFQGIIAGGFEALLRSQEGAEDDAVAGGRAMAERGVRKGDVVVGITASGTAPFVRGALAEARRLGARIIFLTCNPAHQPVSGALAVVLETGPELITGSTRLKAGTATKAALNLISSIAMIRTGRVRDNLMIHVQPTNQKLQDRARRLVQTLARVDADEAQRRLEGAGWDVAKAVS